MNFYSYIVLVFFINTANSTFWNKNDFELVLGSYKSNLSQDYLRALSIFKRKLQLLGFYPIVLNDDGLEYVLLEPYFIEEDYDDQLYKLLKKKKKERKARKKHRKKKSKKISRPSVPTTTMPPISNIVYYWPFPSFQRPNESIDLSQQLYGTPHDVNENRVKNSYFDPYNSEQNLEENESEIASSSFNQENESEKQKPSNIDYERSWSSERKSEFDKEHEMESWTVENQTINTATPHPLTTIFLHPEEIFGQQEIPNKKQENEAETISKHIDVDVTITEGVIVEAKVTKTVDTLLNATDEIPNGENVSEDTIETAISAYPTTLTSTATEGTLQFFSGTLPEHGELSVSVAPILEIVDNVPVTVSGESISDDIVQITENNNNNDGYNQTDTQHNNSTIQVNQGATTIDHSKLDNVHEVDTNPDFSIPTDHKIDESEVYEYSIDTRFSLQNESDNDIESRSLTVKPVVDVIDKNHRRSDVPIEADDLDEEDTTDNLPYNLNDKNLLERSSVKEYTSAETSIPPPPPASVFNFDNVDPIDKEIISLIPIIIKQMKLGNVSFEEMEILQNAFGMFWPFIVEEANRDSNSSEEMHPFLKEVLNSLKRRVAKREATVGRFRRPIYQRRIYYDDDVDFVPRRRYYVPRRRPIIRYY